MREFEHHGLPVALQPALIQWALSMAAGRPWAPFVPSREEVIHEALQLADVRRGDVLYDLGCGDGRVVRIAVEEYGVRRAVCVESRRDLAARAREELDRRGLLDRVRVVEDDMMNVPVTEATVVYLYLLTSVNRLLRPKLERELRFGARVVSLDFEIPGWHPVKVGGRGGWQGRIYVYMKGYFNVPFRTI